MRYLQADVLRTLEKEKRMAFLVGPRQVGKTTLAKSLLPPPLADRSYFNWDADTARKKILKNPDSFWKSESGEPVKRIVLDEIHKYPRWKRFLKGFYDTNRDRVETLVTGSGRLDVYQKGGDSLLGRYRLHHLMPFSVAELVRAQEDKSPEACLQNVLAPSGTDGSEAYQSLWNLNGFPEPLFSGDQRSLTRWQNEHEQLILREDLRDLSQIREIGLIEGMISLLPERIGSPLSLNALREDLGVNFKTVQNWLSVLDRLYFLFAIRPYAGKMARALRREEKVYFYDWSVLEDPGKRLENMVAVHLLKACHYWTDEGCGRFELSYVRDKEKREIDFLVTNKQKPFLLVEVKLSEKEISKALGYFRERLKPAHAFQVVGEAPPDLLSEKDESVYLISASRFLAGLV